MSKTDASPKSRFAAVYGSPGREPRTTGPFKVFWPLMPICFLAGWFFHASLPTSFIPSTLAGFLLIFLAMILILFSLWSMKRLNSYIKGAEGEEVVARTLSFLPSSFTVFNDLQLDEDNPTFDHVVVAPTGIFVIETKNWSGEITFENGHVFCNKKKPSRPPLKQVKDAAETLHSYLAHTRCPEAPIHPVLCFVNNLPQNEIINIGGVRVCNDKDLHELFDNALETPLPGGTLNMITNELKRCVEEK